MNNKGFTILEVLVVITISAVLMIAGVASYNGISEKIQKRVYSGLISDVYIAGEKYTNATGETIVYVRDLLASGYLTGNNGSNVLKDSEGNDLSCYYIDTSSEIDPDSDDVSQGRVWKKSTSEECNENSLIK